MSQYVLIGVIFGLPLLLSLILRIHTSAYFISVTGGFLLAKYLSDTAGLVSSSFLKSGDSSTIAAIVIFLLPVLITFWVMRGSMGGRQVAVQLLPQVGNTLLFGVLLLPFLPDNAQDIVYSSQAGAAVRQASDVIVMLAVILQIFLMYLTARPQHHNNKKH